MEEGVPALRNVRSKTPVGRPVRIFLVPTSATDWFIKGHGMNYCNELAGEGGGGFQTNKLTLSCCLKFE